MATSTRHATSSASPSPACLGALATCPVGRTNQALGCCRRGRQTHSRRPCGWRRERRPARGRARARARTAMRRRTRPRPHRTARLRRCGRGGSVTGGATARRELGSALGRDARIIAHRDQDVVAQLTAHEAAAFEPADRVAVALVDTGRQVVARADRVRASAARRCYAPRLHTARATPSQRRHRALRERPRSGGSSPDDRGDADERAILHRAERDRARIGAGRDSFSSATSAARSNAHAVASTRVAAATCVRSSGAMRTPRR